MRLADDARNTGIASATWGSGSPRDPCWAVYCEQRAEAVQAEDRSIPLSALHSLRRAAAANAAAVPPSTCPPSPFEAGAWREAYLRAAAGYIVDALPDRLRLAPPGPLVDVASSDGSSLRRPLRDRLVAYPCFSWLQRTANTSTVNGPTGAGSAVPPAAVSTDPSVSRPLHPQQQQQQQQQRNRVAAFARLFGMPTEAQGAPTGSTRGGTAPTATNQDECTGPTSGAASGGQIPSGARRPVGAVPARGLLAQNTTTASNNKYPPPPHQQHHHQYQHQQQQSQPPGSSGQYFRVPTAPPPAPVAAAPGPNAETLPGFTSAAQRLEIDIRAGRVAPPPPTPHIPGGGLRRQPFAPPLAAPAAAATPQGDAVIPIGRVLAATANPSGGAAAAGGGGGAKRRRAPSTDSGGEGDADGFPEALLLPDGTVPPKLQKLDPKLVTQVANEIVDRSGRNVGWEDICGLGDAKDIVDESIVWPIMNPGVMTGLRAPSRGVLFFGPPGTGKTMIARAIANRAQCTFFNISASSLMSKWIGEGEKLVRCLFAVAEVKQPSIVFIDEIDSLLSMRGDNENEATRRLKTQFLVQLDGVGTSNSDRVIIIGATNRPESLDEAARRRLEARLYIPLPDRTARAEIVRRSFIKAAAEVTVSLSPEDFDMIAAATEGYSGSDMDNLVRQAAMTPVREWRRRQPPGSGTDSFMSLRPTDLRAVVVADLLAMVNTVRPSVSPSELDRYIKWNEQFGSSRLA